MNRTLNTPSKFLRHTGTNRENELNINDQFGLIILGNLGVGKNFLTNILLGRETIARKCRSNSMTDATDFEEIDIGFFRLAIFNLPSLIKADRQRVDLNITQIDKAFAQRPDSIIMFVFDQKDQINADERQWLKERLLQVVVRCIPLIDEKKQETSIERMNYRTRLFRARRAEYELERDKYINQIEDNLEFLEETNAKLRSDIAFLKIVLKNQARLFREHQRRYEEENFRDQIEMSTIIYRLERIKNNYEQLQKQTTLECQKTFEELETDFDELASRLESQKCIE